MFMSCRFIETQCEISGSHDGASEYSGLLDVTVFRPVKNCTADYFFRSYFPHFHAQTHGTLATEEGKNMFPKYGNFVHSTQCKVREVSNFQSAIYITKKHQNNVCLCKFKVN
jgi:hypothetical protein